MSRKGFTLIELLVVVAVLALLASIVFSNLGGAREGARISNVLSFQSQTHSLLGSDLIGWWRLDGNAEDISGFGNHGNAFNVNWIDGAVGQAAEFSGSNSYIMVDDYNWESSDSFTIVGWAKFNQYSYMQLLDSHNSTGGFQFKWRISSQNPYWNIYNSSNVHIRSLSYNIRPELDQWNHYLFTYDGSFIRNYLNGEPHNQHNVGSVPFSIDEFYFTRSSGEVTFGSLDDVRLYSRALTAGEIQTLYAQTKDRYLAND